MSLTRHIKPIVFLLCSSCSTTTVERRGDERDYILTDAVFCFFAYCQIVQKPECEELKPAIDKTRKPKHI